MSADKFKSLTAEECADLILNVSNPVVISHVHPDADTVGTTAALIEIFRQLGKKAFYYTTDELPERLRFLLERCESADSLAGLTPITVDVASPNQLGKTYEKLDNILFMLDHHEIGTPFADNFIIRGASSAAEVLFEVVDVLKAKGKIELTKALASSLYAAISSDTGGFVYSNTSAKTYRRAAELVECGIDHADINHRLFHSKSRSALKAEGLVARNLETEENGRVAYFALSSDMLVKEGLRFSDFDTAIDTVRSLLGTEVAFFLRETAEGEYKVSLRSTEKNVAEVAKTFGGGGHIRAAGCAVKADTREEAVSKILAELHKIFN